MKRRKIITWAALTASVLWGALSPLGPLDPLSAPTAYAKHHRGSPHAIYYGPHRMGRVACIRVLQGKRIAGLTRAFCKDVIAYRAVVVDDSLYVAIDGYGSCLTIGKWWWVSIDGKTAVKKQQVDCSYPGDEAAQKRAGTVVEVSYLTAVEYGFRRDGHSRSARVWRAY